MEYEVELMDLERSEELRTKYYSQDLFSTKADISGLCIELITADKNHTDMWKDNFYAMSEHIKAHAKIYSIKDETMEMKVLFEPATNVAFLFNFDYYGWIKSIGLGISGNILEESHNIYSIHGAALDIDGVGLTLIAPSKTGKTTQSWGLLRAKNAHMISDDWYFVKLGIGRPAVFGSEKNCYIDADIGDVWEEYKPLIRNIRFDNEGRGIANVRCTAGESSVITRTTMHYIILMKRDPFDPETIRKLTSEEGVKYMIENDMCNPHQMVRSEHKINLRKKFIAEYFSACDIYLVNTIESAKKTQELIRNIVLD